MRLLIAFIAVPLIEIGLFIQVGDAIGLWPTLLVVLLTAIAGTALVRSQGAQVLSALQGSFQAMKDPTEPLAHGAMILFAGAPCCSRRVFSLMLSVSCSSSRRSDI